MSGEAHEDFRFFYVLYQIGEILSKKPFKNLAKMSNWMCLYCVLYKTRHGIYPTENCDEPELHPTCFNDLAHKTRLLFTCQHACRDAAIEGIKRVTSLTYAVIGFVPTPMVRFHGTLDEKEYLFPEKVNPFQLDSGTRGSKRNLLLRLDSKVGVSLRKMKMKSNHLNYIVQAAAVEMSRRFTLAGEMIQGRSWAHIVSTLTTSENIKEAAVPFELRLSYPQLPFSTVQTDLALVDSWYYKLRHTILREIHGEREFKAVSLLLQEKKDAADQVEASKFADILLNSQKSKEYLNKFASMRLKYDSPPGPRLIFAVVAIISEFGSAQPPRSLDRIYSMFNQHGQPSPSLTLLKDITDNQKEIESENYLCQVRPILQNYVFLYDRGASMMALIESPLCSTVVSNLENIYFFRDCFLPILPTRTVTTS